MSGLALIYNTKTESSGLLTLPEFLMTLPTWVSFHVITKLSFLTEIQFNCTLVKQPVFAYMGGGRKIKITKIRLCCTLY